MSQLVGALPHPTQTRHAPRFLAAVSFCLVPRQFEGSVMIGTTTFVMLIAATAIADNAYPPCTQQRTDNCSAQITRAHALYPVP